MRNTHSEILTVKRWIQTAYKLADDIHEYYSPYMVGDKHMSLKISPIIDALEERLKELQQII